MSAAAQRISWFHGLRFRNLFWISDALFLPLSFAWKPRPLTTQRDAAEKICSRPGERYGGAEFMRFLHNIAHFWQKSMVLPKNQRFRQAQDGLSDNAPS
jgi:hypothetical protein